MLAFQGAQLLNAGFRAPPGTTTLSGHIRAGGIGWRATFPLVLSGDCRAATRSDAVVLPGRETDRERPDPKVQSFWLTMNVPVKRHR